MSSPAPVRKSSRLSMDVSDPSASDTSIDESITVPAVTNKVKDKGKKVIYFNVKLLSNLYRDSSNIHHNHFYFQV